MKTLKKTAILFAASALATVGFSAHADALTQKVLPDMQDASDDVIILSIYCAGGNGGDRR
ncbi:MAG: hypothetical protein JJT96_01365 [Opitutales bacterium]|nr:hypothetical protein [Opitutales bacterium]